MTTQPPSPAEALPLPPRNRPSLDTLAQDTTEVDLWAFDDELLLPGAAAPLLTTETDCQLPQSPPPAKTLQAESDQATPSPLRAEPIQISGRKSYLKNQPIGLADMPMRTESEFDDLEHWEPPAAEAPTKNHPAAPEVPNPTAAPEAPNPTAAPGARLPQWQLSTVERLGLLALLAILLVGGTTIVVSSLKRLPREPQLVKARDFPLTNDLITINSATTYWREPVIGTSAPDPIRRGTKLMPVVELTVAGGPAAIRVLFRNQDQTLVGDAVTRATRGGEVLKIPATAGFDDLGMHAAYRTGESKPWTIEVRAAPTTDAPGSAFKKLFEMPISTDLR